MLPQVPRVGQGHAEQHEASDDGLHVRRRVGGAEAGAQGHSNSTPPVVDTPPMMAAAIAGASASDKPSGAVAARL